MSSPKISIVIPVYKAEDYISECLKSCVEQTFKDIEIIVVNDCSPDKSMQIVENYAKKDSRIRIINHEKNRGSGGSRNTGINEACGEYLWFIDSDDYVDIHACQILYNLILQDELDIVQFTSLDFNEKNGEKFFYINKLNNPWTKNKVLNPSDKKSGLSGSPNVTPWSYIVKTNLLKDCLFRENVYHEDVDFTMKLFSKAKRFETVSYTAYYYRINLESATKSKLSAKRLSDMFTVCYELKNEIDKNKYKKGYFVYDAFVDFVRNSKRTIETFDSRDLPEIKEFLQEFRKI